MREQVFPAGNVRWQENQAPGVLPVSSSVRVMKIDACTCKNDAKCMQNPQDHLTRKIHLMKININIIFLPSWRSTIADLRLDVRPTRHTGMRVRAPAAGSKASAKEQSHTYHRQDPVGFPEPENQEDKQKSTGERRSRKSRTPALTDWPTPPGFWLRFAGAEPASRRQPGAVRAAQKQRGKGAARMKAAKSHGREREADQSFWPRPRHRAYIHMPHESALRRENTARRLVG